MPNAVSQPWRNWPVIGGRNPLPYTKSMQFDSRALGLLGLNKRKTYLISTMCQASKRSTEHVGTATQGRPGTSLNKCNLVEWMNSGSFSTWLRKCIQSVWVLLWACMSWSLSIHKGGGCSFEGNVFVDDPEVSNSINLISCLVVILLHCHVRQVMPYFTILL